MTVDDLANKLGMDSSSLFIADTSTNGQYIEYTVVVDSSVECDLSVENKFGKDNLRRVKLD